MKLKYYLILVFVIVVVVGVSFYIFAPGHINTLNIQDNKPIALPALMWLGIAAGLFVVCGVIFFILDWVRAKVRKYKEQKDLSRLVAQILDQTGTDSYTPAVYHHKNFLLLSKILRRFSLVPKVNSQNSGSGRIDQLFDALNQIELGYEQDLRKYGFNKENSFVEKNLINKVKKDYKTGFGILGDAEMKPEFKKKIFTTMLERCAMKDLKKVLEATTFLDKEMLFQAVSTFKKHQFVVPESLLITLCKKAYLSSWDYIDLAKDLKGLFSPDAWVKLFENLALSDEAAELSFLYVLCDLELNTQVSQRLSTLPKNEFLQIRAYMDLHSQGKKYPLDLFLR